jgi:phosphoribosylamine-glycine ligase
LAGKELSLFILSNGRQWKTLGMACDYKRLLNDNLGPNTGGMGCYIPQQWPAQHLMQKIEQEIIVPTLQGLEQEGLQYCGILFIGLMIDENKNDINVIEYNVRFGDPETQTILPAMEQDLALYISSCLGLLSYAPLDQLPALAPVRSSVHVVATSRGYAQGEMLTGRPINMGKMPDGTELFFAAVTAGREQQQLMNDGGRVLGITAVGENLQQARHLAYRGIGEITFDGMHWRTDIARN